MMKAALVFLVYCILVALAQQDNGGFIRGPGGVLLHPDCHVVLPDGARMVDQETIILADGTRQEIPPCIHTSPENNTQVSRGEKRSPDGWNLFSRYFMNAYLDAFNGDWVVPSNPAGGFRNQLLYYFTGLEDASCNCILQPVLWYGYSPAGGGNAWFAAVWYVYNNNQNFITSGVVQVPSGSYISTYMQKTANGWDSGMRVNGNLVTAGSFPQNLQSNAFCTLEVYNVANCDSFPYYTSLTFQNLAIAQSGVGPVGFNNANWAIFNQNTECGQNMACDGNHCTMNYGAAYPCPANIGALLRVGQAITSNGGAGSWLVASDCGFRLVMQTDGNLVLYDIFNRPVFYTSTGGVGQGPFTLVMQGDGNLVLYDATGYPTWNTGTGGFGVYPYVFVVQTDANLVIYDANNSPIWYSRH